jgi:hypothetical protein
MTLWAIARSPLIYGADIRAATSAADFALMTNPEVLAVTRGSAGNKPVPAALLGAGTAAGTVVWSASGTDGEAGRLVYYVAFVKRGPSTATAAQQAEAEAAAAVLGVGTSGAKAISDMYAPSLPAAPPTLTVSVSYAALGLPAAITQCTVRDLWARAPASPAPPAGTVEWQQPVGKEYDGGLFSLTDCR